MSKALEFGGGDNMNVECEEMAFLESLKHCSRVKNNKKREVNSINMVVQELRRKLFHAEQKTKRDQKHQISTIIKLLSECEAEEKHLEGYNEQIIKMFEAWVEHEHLILLGIQEKTLIISHLIENYGKSTETSGATNEKENDQLISAMCKKLQDLYEKYVIQQKKAKLENFIKKLIEEENLF